jgi:hypothetical protein
LSPTAGDREFLGTRSRLSYASATQPSVADGYRGRYSAAMNGYL